MNRFKIVLYFVLIACFASNIFSQTEKPRDIKPDNGKKYLSWTLLQLIPSPVFTSDANNDDARIQLAAQWQLIPLNISFNANKYVSPVQFFMINPVRRFTGSAEIFVQPEITTASFKYSGFHSFGLNLGSRIIIPVQEMGENIALSIGGKYAFRENSITGDSGYPGIEAGVYFLGGQIGMQFTKNFHKNNLYTIGLYIKYF